VSAILTQALVHSSLTHEAQKEAEVGSTPHYTTGCSPTITERFLYRRLKNFSTPLISKHSQINVYLMEAFYAMQDVFQMWHMLEKKNSKLNF